MPGDAADVATVAPDLLATTKDDALSDLAPRQNVKFDRNGTTGFEGPYIDSQGGGNSFVGYNSQWVKKALTIGGATVLGIIEQ